MARAVRISFISFIEHNPRPSPPPRTRLAGTAESTSLPKFMLRSRRRFFSSTSVRIRLVASLQSVRWLQDRAAGSQLDRKDVDNHGVASWHRIELASPYDGSGVGNYAKHESEEVWSPTQTVYSFTIIFPLSFQSLPPVFLRQLAPISSCSVVFELVSMGTFACFMILCDWTVCPHALSTVYPRIVPRSRLQSFVP